MTKDDINFFKRYLKERGIYAVFFREAKRFPKRRGWLSVNDFLKNYDYPINIINILLHWGLTELGADFWVKEDTRYRSKYRQYLEYGNEVFEDIKRVSL